MRMAIIQRVNVLYVVQVVKNSCHSIVKRMFYLLNYSSDVWQDVNKKRIIHIKKTQLMSVYVSESSFIIISHGHNKL